MESSGGVDVVRYFAYGRPFFRGDEFDGGVCLRKESWGIVSAGHCEVDLSRKKMLDFVDEFVQGEVSSEQLQGDLDELLAVLDDFIFNKLKEDFALDHDDDLRLLLSFVLTRKNGGVSIYDLMVAKLKTVRQLLLMNERVDERRLAVRRSGFKVLLWAVLLSVGSAAVSCSGAMERVHETSVDFRFAE